MKNINKLNIGFIGLGKLGLPVALAIDRSAADMAMNPAMMSGVSDAVLPGVENLSGPLWFRRMDRNQDGDVSLREFPGTAAQFQQLDSDADGLISTTEAEAVEAGK